MPKQKLQKTTRARYVNHDWHPELVEHSQDLLCTHDLQGRLLSISPAPARVLGYSVEELLQKSMPEIIAPEFRSEFEQYIHQIQTNGEACGAVVVLTRQGERRIWQFHNTLQADGLASPVVHGIAQDVTERRDAQATLRESEHRLRIIYEKSPVGMCMIETRTGRFLEANPKCCEILGQTEEQLLARDLQSVSHPEEAASIGGMIHEVAGEGPGPYDGERRLLRQDGSVCWVKLSVVSAADEGKESAATMVVVQDITDHKRAESSLRASETHFRLLLEQASDGIFVSDAGGRYLDVNSAGTVLLKYSREEILGFTIADLLAPHEVPRLQQEVSRLATGGIVRSEWQFRRKDGSLFPGEVTARQLPDGRLQAIVRDLTEQKLASEAVTTLIKQVRSESGEIFFSEIAGYLAKFLSADCTVIGNSSTARSHR